MPASFPELTPGAVEALERHNRLWGERQGNWLRHAVPPFWGRDLILTPEMRGIYNAWLPYRDFVQSLCRIGRSWLPDAAWLPYPLRCRAYLSLPDFWAAMPETFGGRLVFCADELLPLFCAMADPPRFGTIPGRYPGQTERLGKICGIARIVDVACGVGMNTLEIAEALEGRAQVLGITGEHLEVWMAEKRLLPHDAARQRQMDAFSKCRNAEFAYGIAENFSVPVPVDAVVCNGLLGGRFFASDMQLEGFLASCLRCLRPGGRIFAANHFHEGFRHGVCRLMRLAAERGFRVSGSWQELELEACRPGT